MNTFIQFLPLILVLLVGYAIYIGVTRRRGRNVEALDLSDVANRSSDELLDFLMEKYLNYGMLIPTKSS